MKKIVVGFFLVSVFSSCITSNVVVNIQRPADITVSQDIQNVVIANRSRPSKENLTGNIVEGIISGEGIGTDRRGAESCIDGLINMLGNSERFILKNTDGIELKGVIRLKDKVDVIKL